MRINKQSDVLYIMRHQLKQLLNDLKEWQKDPKENPSALIAIRIKQILKEVK